MFCCVKIKVKKTEPILVLLLQVVAERWIHSDFRKTPEMTTSAAAAAVAPTKNASSERPPLPMM